MSTNLNMPISKILPRHLERWALVYLRQSTAQQLVRNQESTRLQYALRDRALALGWEANRIEVIDDDLGRSGISAEGRPGFQRLVAEVGLDHVGIIVGLEMSRFARSCRDWHQLLEICALFGTLIADLDGVYDPADHNDRLLLGLKGTISEAELYLVKRRLLDGRLAKAQRGELGKSIPIGYHRRPSGEVIKDPDEQARAIVETIFEQFEQLGTTTGVMRYLKEHGLRMPVRERSGPQMGELAWQRPVRMTLTAMLKNPMYSGAYVYGRRAVDPRLKTPGRPGTGIRLVPQEKWKVLLPGRFPAYITWEQYQRNQELMFANRPQHTGTARQGEAMLVGLIYCGRCGRRMRPAYGERRFQYLCVQAKSVWLDPLCQSLTGAVLDAEIERQVLEALKPAALEVSLAVAADLEAKRAKEERLWGQKLERAKYESERAQRHYYAVEPENRLVARTLEGNWEEKLQALRQMEEEYHRHRAQAPVGLTPGERERIQTLAEDIPGLWHAPQTTWAHRKEIVRQLIDRVTVAVVGESERVQVVTSWAGGHETRTEIVRPVRNLNQLSYLNAMLDRVQALREAGESSRTIAQKLNEEHWRPAKRRCTFTPEMVRQMLCRRGLTRKGKKRKPVLPDLGPDDWTLEALASELALPLSTIYTWVHRGWVQARKDSKRPSRWIIHAEASDLEQLRILRVTRPQQRNAIRQASGKTGGA